MQGNSRRSIVLLLAAVLFIAISSAASATVYVKWDSPGPTFNGRSWQNAFHTVQQGVNLAAAGEEIWVAQGLYTEWITSSRNVALYGGFNGTETARGQRYARITTLRPPDYSRPTVTVVDSTIDGFTFMGGMTGIRGTGSTVVQGNIMIGFQAAAISCGYGSPVIRCNSISGGGGISFGVVTNGIIERNIIRDGAGAISTQGSSLTIANNVIARNSNGLWCYDGPLTIVNNTIVGNSVPGGDLWSGVGIGFIGRGCTFANNIVAFNSGAGILDRTGGTAFALSHNNVYGNGKNYEGTQPGATDISTDPLFENAAGGNFGLPWNSPCVDAGDNSLVPPGEIDLAGNPRIVDGNADGLAVVDIGAYEYEGPPIITGWRGWMSHGPAGFPRAIDLSPGSVTSESRLASGCQRPFQTIRVDFSRIVSVTGTVKVQDLTHGCLRPADSQQVLNNGDGTSTLILSFNTPLQDRTCYRVDVAGCVPGLAGDMDCTFRMLAGDTNSDGRVNLTDMAQVKSKLSQDPAAPGNARFDVNRDGKIDLIDVALVRGLNGSSVPSP